jgi:parallel beta-helix repeat protein
MTYHFPLIASGYFNVKLPYGANAVGNGTQSSSAAIQGAIAAAAASVVAGAGSGVVYFPPGKYLLSAKLTVPSYVTLYGYGALLYLANGVDDHVISVNAGATKVTIVGLEINGNKTNNTGGHGIVTNNGSLIRIEDCYIHDCDQDGVRFGGTTTTDVIVTGCYVSANGTAGITCDSTTERFSFTNNVAADNGTHNIGCIGIGKHGTIADNVCKGAGLADNITAYNVGCDHLSVTGNVCVGGANNGIHLGGSNLLIADNLVDAPTQHGIVIVASGGGTSVNAIVSDNVVDSAGAAGIDVEVANGVTVSGNQVFAAGAHGIWAITVTQGTIEGNTIRNCTNVGVNAVTCSRLSVTGNTIEGNSTGISINTTSSDCVVDANVCESNATGHGVLLSAAQRCVVSDNHLRTNKYAIEEFGATDYSVIVGNSLSGNTTSNTIDLVGANSTVGVNGGYNPNPLALTLASNAVTIPGYRREPILMITLAGEGGAADQLDTIFGGIPGQIVVLTAFSGTVDITVTGVNNIYTAGGASFLLDNTPDIIMLQKSAALNAWVEITRSNNG